jgi:hypothetical protein
MKTMMEVRSMLKERRLSNSAGSIQSGFVDPTVWRGASHYSVLRDPSEDNAPDSPVVAASAEEKVSDLIRSFPYLKAFLKSHSNGQNARIRDLAISTRERNHLLCQLIAARRQQLLTSGRTEGRPLSARSSRLRPGSS